MFLYVPLLHLFAFIVGVVIGMQFVMHLLLLLLRPLLLFILLLLIIIVIVAILVFLVVVEVHFITIILII